MPSDLVGRPGLDPGTLGLKVLVTALYRVADRRTVSQNTSSRLQLRRFAETGWNLVRRNATHLLGQGIDFPRKSFHAAGSWQCAAWIWAL